MGVEEENIVDDEDATTPSGPLDALVSIMDHFDLNAVFQHITGQDVDNSLSEEVAPEEEEVVEPQTTPSSKFIIHSQKANRPIQSRPIPIQVQVEPKIIEEN